MSRELSGQIRELIAKIPNTKTENCIFTAVNENSFAHIDGRTTGTFGYWFYSIVHKTAASWPVFAAKRRLVISLTCEYLRCDMSQQPKVLIISSFGMSAVAISETGLRHRFRSSYERPVRVRMRLGVRDQSSGSTSNAVAAGSDSNDSSRSRASVGEAATTTSPSAAGSPLAR